MLGEAWLGTPVDRVALRDASRDQRGGSSMRDLSRGYAFGLGIELLTSPSGGERLTFDDLRSRLSVGGAAVVFGAYASLPADLSRFDPKFAARGVDDSRHAVYLNSYDPASDRFWWMDPLGRGDYDGEWVAASIVETFVWTNGRGHVWAAATPAPSSRVTDLPTRPLDPFADLAAGEAQLGKQSVGSTFDVFIPLASESARILPGVTLSGSFTHANDPTVGSEDVGAEPAAVTASLDVNGLWVRVQLPREPGKYVFDWAATAPDGRPLGSGSVQVDVKGTIEDLPGRSNQG